MALHTLDNDWVRQAVFVAKFDGASEAATQAWPIAAEIVLLTAAPHTGQVLAAAAADDQVYEVAAVRPSDDSNRAVVVVGHSARNQPFANDHPACALCLSTPAWLTAADPCFRSGSGARSAGRRLCWQCPWATRRCYRCRVSRIDLNIVHDHAPAAFMADLPEFVRQVNDPDLLNLFATALRDEDVAKSMYAGMDGGPSESKCLGKTSAVCRALRPVLQLLDQQRYMPTMLTTLVCQLPADIPGALQLLSPLDTEARDAALMCLLYLSDVDTVDNAALGMYDLPLALAVAQRSQHDPREYLPAQRKVHAIASDEYHRYKIDVQLALHDQALQPRTTRLSCGASCADSVGPTWPTGGRQAGSRSRQSTTRQSGPAQSWPITTALPTPPLCCSTVQAHTRTPGAACARPWTRSWRTSKRAPPRLQQRPPACVRRGPPRSRCSPPPTSRCAPAA
ncbi:putative elongator complex protein 1, partial [Coemansia helicoidea]